MKVEQEDVLSFFSIILSIIVMIISLELLSDVVGVDESHDQMNRACDAVGGIPAHRNCGILSMPCNWYCKKVDDNGEVHIIEMSYAREQAGIDIYEECKSSSTLSCNILVLTKQIVDEIENE